MLINFCSLVCKMELVMVCSVEGQHEEAVFTQQGLEECPDQRKHLAIGHCVCDYLLSPLVGTANVMSTCWVPTHMLDFLWWAHQLLQSSPTWKEHMEIWRGLLFARLLLWRSLSLPWPSPSPAVCTSTPFLLSPSAWLCRVCSMFKAHFQSQACTHSTSMRLASTVC